MTRLGWQGECEPRAHLIEGVGRLGVGIDFGREPHDALKKLCARGRGAVSLQDAGCDCLQPWAGEASRLMHRRA